MPVRTTKGRIVPSQLKSIPKLHMAISAHCPHCGTTEISQSCPDLICWRCKSPLCIQSCVMPEIPPERDATNVNRPVLSPRQKEKLDAAVDRLVNEYGDALKKLAKE